MPCEIITIQPGNAGPEATLEVVTPRPCPEAMAILARLEPFVPECRDIRRGILLPDDEELREAGRLGFLALLDTKLLRSEDIAVLRRAWGLD